MIYIVRHGETAWNYLGKIMGRCDEPLNENGIRQAYEVKEQIDKIHLDLIICSPLVRAIQTAEIINKDKKLEIIKDEKIIERDYGEFEGQNKNNTDYQDVWNYNLNKQFEKAENIKVFFDRIYGFLDDIKKKYPDKDILLVCHGGVSMAVECYFRHNIPEGHLNGTGLALKNCEVRSYSF